MWNMGSVEPHAMKERLFRDLIQTDLILVLDYHGSGYVWTREEWEESLAWQGWSGIPS